LKFVAFRVAIVLRGTVLTIQQHLLLLYHPSVLDACSDFGYYYLFGWYYYYYSYSTVAREPLLRVVGFCHRVVPNPST
jgi:hypothetical protein